MLELLYCMWPLSSRYTVPTFPCKVVHNTKFFLHIPMNKGEGNGLSKVKGDLGSDFIGNACACSARNV
jgi:hypothetical protein